MRRNLITFILWFSAIILFLLHMVLIHRQDDKQFADLVNIQNREVKATVGTGKSLQLFKGEVVYVACVQRFLKTNLRMSNRPSSKLYQFVCVAY